MKSPDTAARAAVLSAIRGAIGPRSSNAGEEYQAISREYRQAGALDEQGCIHLLVDRLQHYQVGVYRCGRAELPGTIAEALGRSGGRRMLVPSGLPRDWLPPGLEIVEDAALSHRELDATDGVITGCSQAIASTGTIVLRHGPAEGRRALTLVPDYHLCVVFTEQVVQTVPEAFEVLERERPALVTTISGPSATADIEMTRIRGVHGPRRCDVILVGP